LYAIVAAFAVTPGQVAGCASQRSAATARFVDGVAVIVRPIAGAMAEASVGGQQFTYVPK